MSLTRICEACDRAIEAETFVNLHAEIWDTGGPETQDASLRAYGDFCRPCVKAGKAVAELLASIDRRAKAKCGAVTAEGE